MSELTLIVPMTPPSVNSYVRHTRRGGHYKSAEAESFEFLMAEICRGECVEGKKFSVEMDVYFGPGEKRDVDNMAKLPIDCMARAGVFAGKSDSHVVKLSVNKDHPRQKLPRTEIRVRGL